MDLQQVTEEIAEAIFRASTSRHTRIQLLDDIATLGIIHVVAPDGKTYHITVEED